MRHRLVKWWCNFLLRLASGGYKFSVRQSTSCPTKRFNSSALRLHQSTPDLRTIIRYPSCVSTFITSFSIFIPKPNSKLPFFKWLSRALSLSPNTISYCFSHLLCWELFGHRRRWTPTTRLTVSFKKNMSHLAWLNSCGFISWKKKISFLVVIFNWSLWLSQASLDQSMLCKDERSKFKPARRPHSLIRNIPNPSSSSRLRPSLLLSPLCSCTVPMHILLLLLDDYYLLH